MKSLFELLDNLDKTVIALMIIAIAFVWLLLIILDVNPWNYIVI